MAWQSLAHRGSGAAAGAALPEDVLAGLVVVAVEAVLATGGKAPRCDGLPDGFFIVPQAAMTISMSNAARGPTIDTYIFLSPFPKGSSPMALWTASSRATSKIEMLTLSLRKRVSP